MASILESMKRAVESMVEGYNTYNIDAIIDPRAPDCVQHVLPKSLGRGPQSNEEYKQFMLGVWPRFTDWKFIADNVVYDAEARKCAFHATGTAQTPVGTYNQEYAWFLSFNESGKIIELWEFVDSKYITDLLAKLAAHGNDESNDKKPSS